MIGDNIINREEIVKSRDQEKGREIRSLLLKSGELEPLMFWDHRLCQFFLQIKAEGNNEHHLGKIIFKQIGKACKYFYNFLITYCLSLFISVLLLLLLQLHSNYSF